MADLSSFRVLFPEFVECSDALVSAHMSMAALEVDADIWLTLTDPAVYYLTAHKIALSPYAMQAKMADKSGMTTYWSEYQRLMRACTSGFRAVLV